MGFRIDGPSTGQVTHPQDVTPKSPTTKPGPAGAPEPTGPRVPTTGRPGTSGFDSGTGQGKPLDLFGAPTFGDAFKDLVDQISGVAVALTGSAAFDTVAQADPAEAAGKAIPLTKNYGPGGTYYRKVESTPDATNAGIQATVTLPTATFDSTRIDGYANESAPWNHTPGSAGPREHPTVYLGGSGQGAKGQTEVDCGLTWMPVLEGKATPTFTDQKEMGTDGGDPSHVFVPKKTADGTQQLWRKSDIGVDGAKPVAEGKEEVAKYINDNLVPNYAYRVFFRSNSGKENVYGNPDPTTESNPYFYPGQKVELGVTITGPGKAQLSANLEGDTTGGYSGSINAPGFGGGQEVTFKRVTSIDQEKEGDDDKAPMEATTTTLSGAIWHQVSLQKDAAGDKKTKGYAAAGEKLQTVPLTGDNAHVIYGKDIGDQHKKVFTVSTLEADGGERIDIDAGKYTPKK